MPESRTLQGFTPPIQLKLAMLWASVVFCYIYGDYFGLYVPGTLQSMLDGRMGPLGPTTQNVLLGTTVLMAIPSLMPIACLMLRPGWNRVANLLFGLVYSVVMALTLAGAWRFYQLLGVVEILLTLAVCWYAWKWPRVSQNSQDEPARSTPSPSLSSTS
ncbi:MAG TPA: DUF6326 family protein [Rhodanobacteraceae bacterium]|nr:DUF6326 family protein [Rhodanobacteraceae bacterium]